MKHPARAVSLLILIPLYLGTLGAPFFSPYSPKEQFREYFYQPPSSITFRDASGRWGLRPYARLVERVDLSPEYRHTGELAPVRFLVTGAPYRWLGMDFETHLFGLEGTDQPIFLLGSDALGRDLFSRILAGAQFSLSIGLTSIFFTMILGVCAGLAAGYFSGWLDAVLMRLAESLLALPNIFLILGVQAVLPRDLALWELFWLMVSVFTLLGWVTVARVVRGQTLSLRKREHVLAARVVGASDFRILTRHIFPLITGYLYVQATLLIPTFTLGEITLSFLGVGVQEPDASWGNLLRAAGSVRTLTQFPWLLSPAIFIFAAVLGFNLLGNQLREPEARSHFW